MDRDIAHFGMGFSTGVTAGVLLTIGTIGFVGWRGVKGLGGGIAEIARRIPEPKEPHLATVTELRPEENESEDPDENMPTFLVKNDGVNPPTITELEEEGNDGIETSNNPTTP